MTPSADILFVSPHLDDAVLSAGATVATLTASGHRVLVATVFAGVPSGRLSAAARSFHRACALSDDAVRVRRWEDRLAVGVLGAGTRHLGFLDALYRRRRAGGWLCRREEDVVDLPCEPDLTEQVTRALLGLIEATGCRKVVTCAGIGRHVDHRITVVAASRAALRAGRPLLLWEDLPYALGLAAPAGVDTWPARIPTAAWAAKWAAVSQYGSQLRMLWPSAAGWRPALEAHAATRAVDGVPGEYLWHGGVNA